MSSEQTVDHDRQDKPPGNSSMLLWLICLVAIGAAASVFFSSRDLGTATHAAVGRPAPELDLVPLIAAKLPEQSEPPADSEASAEGAVSLTGKPPSGKVTMLHFWGTWCPPCRAEYPELVEMVRELEAEERFQFVSVSCEGGPGETFERLQSKTQKYYESIGAGDLMTYADASGKTRTSAAEAMGAPSMMYPTTLIIDTNQRIAGIWQGYSPASVGEMKTMITTLAK